MRLLTITFISMAFLPLQNQASSTLSFEAHCLKPMVLNKQLHVVCQKNNRTFKYIVDKNLTITKKNELDFDTNIIKKRISIDEKHNYIITQNKPECIKIYNLDTQTNKTELIASHCERSTLSFFTETHNLDYVLPDNTAIFPMLKENVVLLLMINSKDFTLSTATLDSLENHEAVSLIEFADEGVLCLSGNAENPLGMALVSIKKGSDDKLLWKPSYMSEEIFIGAFINIQNKAFISGLTVKNNKVNFSLDQVLIDQVSTTGKKTRIFENNKMNFYPVTIVFDKKIIVYGLVVENNSTQVTVVNVEMGIPPYPQIQAVLDIENRAKNLPVFIDNNQHPYILLLDNQVAKLVTYSQNDWQTHLLQSHNIDTTNNHPSIVHFGGKDYIFYQIIEAGKHEDVIESIE